MDLSRLEKAEAEAAQAVARAAWMFLQDCGLMRPGMHIDRPVGVLWAECGLPIDMAAFALAQALHLPEEEELHLQPEDTLCAAALRRLKGVGVR